ncbi:Uu.00g033620.m01.CDS01 [Anthostomella pinea]|uniref:Uu.00g033620.m01.CDS01 n=1 Tax=Anthostomella pinea TaxID=933095 RepID=A0AAI8V8X1_9PEZI|nr:Uu.00g033620.m01.CDS01 [Anthostomella pinea]
MATHLAAVLPTKGQPFEVQARLAPKPGPGELLIAVKSVALNPADHIMRSTGLFIPTYPTITGFDIAGLVLEVGDDVPTDHGPGPRFLPGITRIAAYAASVWRSCDPDYGAFQERCLVPWQHAVPLPDNGVSISWNQAATLPAAVQTPLCAWDAMGIPRMGEGAASRDIGKREALLIWGASSSVGTMGVQTARLLRDDPTSAFAAVYATAGAANKSYVGSLGADRVFDYKDPQVVNAIVSAARSDGLVIRHCFLATGQLALCQAVLKTFVGDQEGGAQMETAKIGSAPPVPADAEVVSGVETIMVMPPMVEEERLRQFQYWLGTHLRDNLAKGTIRPSPEPKVVGKGVEAINDGLDLLLHGVSCTKLVVELAE